MVRTRLLVVFVVAVLTGAVLTAGPTAAQEGELSPADAVVALVDTGINPYHVVFRDNSPRAFQHPSTYIEGYPADAIALELSLDAPDYWEAVRRDCEQVWSTLERGQLYWFPGTKIIGAISFANVGNVNCNAGQPSGAMILDYGGHGTMVSSRAAGEGYGACPECKVVMVQGFTYDSVTWAGEHADWIDAQSNSWGAIAPVWEPTGASGTLLNHPAGVRAIENAAQRHLAFWASGNGAATRGGVIGLPPTTTDPRMTPSVIAVGGHDSGQVNVWPNFPPHLVSDSCDAWAARRDRIEESGERVAGGTSGATPFVAGGAAQLLREARTLLGDTRTGVRDGVVAQGDAGTITDGPLADGALTLEEWQRVIYATATPRPERQLEDGPPCAPGPYGPLPVAWTDVPDGYPEYLHIGYGAVDGPAVELGTAVLRGEAALPDRSETDTFFAANGTVSGGLHQVYRGP